MAISHKENQMISAKPFASAIHWLRVVLVVTFPCAPPKRRLQRTHFGSFAVPATVNVPFNIWAVSPGCAPPIKTV